LRTRSDSDLVIVITLIQSFTINFGGIFSFLPIGFFRARRETPVSAAFSGYVANSNPIKMSRFLLKIDLLESEIMDFYLSTGSLYQFTHTLFTIINEPAKIMIGGIKQNREQQHADILILF